MEIPTISKNAGIYTLLWPKNQIAMKVDRLRESRGTVSAELVITTTLPGCPAHLHQAHANLSSTRERGILIKQLEKRIPEIPWDEMLEQCCVLVLREHRRGEPVEDMSQVANEVSHSYLLDPFILDGEPTMIFGDGGVGKSMFVLYLAMLAQTGTHDEKTKLGASRAVNVLYLDYETTRKEIRSRMESIKCGLNWSVVPPVLYRRCHRQLADEVEDLQKLIMDYSISLIVIDSAGAACGGELQYAETVLRFFTSVRALNTGTLITHHVSKPAEGRSSTPYGSVFFRNYARSVWEQRAVGEYDDTETTIGLFDNKFNAGPKRKPVGLSLVKSEGMMQFKHKPVEEIADFQKKLSIADRIIASLVGGSRTTQDLSQYLEVSDSAIRMAIMRESKSGNPRFARLPDEKVGLLTKEQNEPF